MTPKEIFDHLKSKFGEAVIEFKDDFPPPVDEGSLAGGPDADKAIGIASVVRLLSVGRFRRLVRGRAVP